jgi:hypothetical protein
VHSPLRWYREATWEPRPTIFWRAMSPCSIGQPIHLAAEGKAQARVSKPR